MPLSGMSGVGHSPSSGRPSFGRAARARHPLALVAVCGRGGPHPPRCVRPRGRYAPWGARFSLAPSCVPCFGACCARFPGLRHPVAVVACHLSVCPGCGQQRASRACLVVLRCCTVPRPVRSLFVLRSAFPSPLCLPLPGAFAPGFTAPLSEGLRRRPRTGLMVPAAGRCGGRGDQLALRRTRSGPCDGVFPGWSLRRWCWAAQAALVWRVWRPSFTPGFPHSPSFDGGLGRCSLAVLCGRPHLSFQVGGR